MKRSGLSVALVMLASLVARSAPAATGRAADYAAAVDKAVQFLTRTQGDNGAFSPQASPAITALVAAGLLKNGRTADDPVVAKALKYLDGFVQSDGGIYPPSSSHKNYETSVALVAYAAANRDGRYDQRIAAAEKFLKGEQWDETEGQSPADVNYGGAGYGGKKRPDLSNTSFLLDALRAVGNGPEDPAIQKALVFVSRCQNLESAANTTPFAAKNPDGGFYYTPAAGGASMAGQTDEGGLRSYGSMTYAGLKSLIYAGLTANDPRVKAAKEWIAKHYDLDSNPGMGTAGLYYYYHGFAKALDALGSDEFVSADGTKHPWRQELLEAITSRQRDDGAWINDNARWMESDPNLVTAYALLSLSYCRPQGGK